METLATIAKFIGLGAFLVILFYFFPRAMDRLRAKAPSRFDFWWHTVGWMGESEVVPLLFWMLLGFGLAVLLAGLK